MRKFEYLWLQITPRHPANLNAYGAQGWEIIYTLIEKDTSFGDPVVKTTHLMKRELVEKPPANAPKPAAKRKPNVKTATQKAQ